MSFEPDFEKINYTCEKKNIVEQIKSECKVEIPVEEITSILNVSAWSVISEKTVDDGKIGYGGKIIFYISYIGADGILKKYECGSEFRGELKGEVSIDSKVTVNASVDKSYCDLGGIKPTAVAFVTITAEVYTCGQVSALVGGENLVVNESEVSCVKSLGVKTATYPLEEEFQLGYPVAEVLSHRAQSIITAVQCGVGCIIVDGEVILSAIMLQKDGKNGIIKENRILPFRMEIECEEAMPNMQATARVKEKSFKTDVTVDEDGGLSVVSVSVMLMFEGEAFYTDSVLVATDAFSTEQEVELITRDFKYYKSCEIRSCTAVVSGRCAVEEMPVGVTVLAVGSEKAEIIKSGCDGDLTLISGTLSAVAYVRDNEGKTFTVRLETPFDCGIDCSYPCNTGLDIIVKAKSAKARLVSLTEVELECELNFTVYPEEVNDLRVIGEIKPLGEKAKSDLAVSVYIPACGEDMWSLAKRLNVCPETLAQTNSDLQFPLTGDERIVIYRQR
ncbi:MAG: DUF3794 domain-containing protein [Clostridia bacterium]|nr:DUF3794 domain-containing protein [Clostridia bacterium]